MYPESMEIILRKELQVALEEYDVERLRNMKMQDDLISTKELIFTLWDGLSSTQAKRKELLKNQDDKEKDALKEKCQKPSQENIVMKNEMQALTMRVSKDIEDQNNNEENLSITLKDRSEECI